MLGEVAFPDGNSVTELDIAIRRQSTTIEMTAATFRRLFLIQCSSSRVPDGDTIS